MQKKYLIFDLDGTLIESMHDSEAIVFSFLREIPSLDLERARYIFRTTMWTPLLTQLEMICEWFNVDTKILSEKIYDAIYTLDARFFPWVRETIRELSEDYTLFLTTGNSTRTAVKHLDAGCINDCFALILWSDRVLKWPDHLDLFEKYTDDREFALRSLYIGDGDSDRRFAQEKNIDFIHIGNTGIDRYELSSVADIWKILLIWDSE